MSEFPHDDFAKAFLTELLSRIGTAKANHPLKSETLIADLWFELNPPPQTRVPQLGLLGTLRTIHEDELPELWLIMPTASATVRSEFAVSPTVHPGVYRFPEGQRIGLIVVHQLLPTEETLWLRMLGRNGKQQRAIGEFSQTPTGSELYASIEEILVSYRANLESRRQLTPEEEALIMQLSDAYLKKREEWKEEGIQQGIQQAIEAMNLLSQGISIAAIAETTGLSIAAVEQIRQRQGN
jgi:hypothetical protein